MKDVTIRDIVATHRERQKLWHQGAKPWTLADWGNALAGEIGEVCNKIKKIRRIQLDMTGQQLRNQPDHVGPLIGDIAGELGGAFVYMIALADALQIDLTDAIRDEFNKVSTEQGFDVFIPARPEIDPIEAAARALKPAARDRSPNLLVDLATWNALQTALEAKPAQPTARPGPGPLRKAVEELLKHPVSPWPDDLYEILNTALSEEP